ncbi:MAG: hypothetical protein RLY49_444 [Candidatus Parcubacteria bacterium]|jgi:hypothetical protein
MCIIVDDVEREYKSVPEVQTLCEDWRQERMHVLETILDFEKIHWPLIEIDRRFENMLSFVLEFAGVEAAP